MKRRLLLFKITLLQLTLFSLYGQVNTVDYFEKLSIETNSNFFIPGEEIQVAIRSSLEDHDFDLSTVAYLELLDAGNNPVIQQKVQLTKGRASASIYLSSYLKSGNYTLIVYTKWSKNFMSAGYASRCISIINPFNTIPQSILIQNASYDSLKLSLFPEGGQFYALETQKVGFQVVNEFNELVPAFIEIRDGNDSLIFSAKNTFKGLFDLNPIPLTEYSISLIDTLDRIYLSRFQLGNLIERPAFIAESDDHFEIRLTSNTTARSMRIAMNGVTILEQDLNESQVVISKAELPRGLMYVTLMNEENQVILHQVVFNDPDRIQLSYTLPSALKTGKSYELYITSPDEMDVTISIRKKEPITSRENQVTVYYLTNELSNHTWPDHPVEPDDLIFVGVNSDGPSRNPDYLPDFRGELISGVLRDEKGNPIPKHDFFLTTEGSTHQIYPVSTNENGAFKVPISPSYDYERLIFSTQGNYQIKLENPFQRDMNYPSPDRMLVDKLSLEDWLVPKSLQVQLDNIYKDVSTATSPIKGLFESQTKVSYDLDDFTRFPSLADPIQEYIPLLVMKKENGKTRFYLRNVENKTIDYPVLSTIDGIVCEPDAILSLDQSFIDCIEVYNSQFQLGDHFYSGAVNFLSYPDSDVSQLLLQYFKNVNQNGTVEVATSKDKERTSNQPAMNVQLLWEPYYKLKAGSNRIEFETSDVPGIYEVKITGATPTSYIYKSIELKIENQ